MIERYQTTKSEDICVQSRRTHPVEIIRTLRRPDQHGGSQSILAHVRATIAEYILFTSFCEALEPVRKHVLRAQWLVTRTVETADFWNSE